LLARCTRVSFEQCIITNAYKQAIVDANEEDIVWTNKMAGTNSSVILTDQVSEGGLRTNAFVSWLLQSPFKGMTRLYLLNNALKKYDQAAFDENCQYWQAGKGVNEIKSIQSVAEVMKNFE